MRHIGNTNVTSILPYLTVEKVSSVPYLNRNVSTSEELRSVPNVEISQTNAKVTQKNISIRERSSMIRPFYNKQRPLDICTIIATVIKSIVKLEFSQRIYSSK